MKIFRKSKPVSSDTTKIVVPDGFDIPQKTKWAFTPELQTRVTENGMSGEILTGTKLAPHISLHHDGNGEGFSIQWPEDYSKGLLIEFSEFPSSFFSLAFDLPLGIAGELVKQGLLRIVLSSRSDEPIEAYTRLNIENGPNTEQIVRMIEIGSGESYAEFDIYYSEFEGKNAKSAWIDLIINNPSHKRITLEEVIILCRARASL